MTDDQIVEKKLITCETFNSLVMRLIKFAELKLEHGGQRDAGLTNIKERIRLARNIDTTAVIIECKDELWAHRDMIERCDYAQILADVDAKLGMSAPSISTMLAKIYSSLTQDEKNMLMGIVKQLLACVVDYKLLTRDFSDS